MASRERPSSKGRGARLPLSDATNTRAASGGGPQPAGKPHSLLTAEPPAALAKKKLPNIVGRVRVFGAATALGALGVVISMCSPSNRLPVPHPALPAPATYYSLRIEVAAV